MTAGKIISDLEADHKAAADQVRRLEGLLSNARTQVNVYEQILAKLNMEVE